MPPGSWRQALMCCAAAGTSSTSRLNCRHGSVHPLISCGLEHASQDLLGGLAWG